jgi:hypothetical protein
MYQIYSKSFSSDVSQDSSFNSLIIASNLFSQNSTFPQGELKNHSQNPLFFIQSKILSSFIIIQIVVSFIANYLL